MSLMKKMNAVWIIESIPPRGRIFFNEGGPLPATFIIVKITL